MLNLWEPLLSKQWIIEKILPVRRVHILAGASGSGKTTYLFQHLPMWEKGLAIHGHASTPAPWVYISCDRPPEETVDTLERVGVDPGSIRWMSLLAPEFKHLTTANSLIDHVKKTYPDARLLVIDAFYVLTPDMKYNDNGAVKTFLTHLAVLCQQHNITIIGTAHSPKMKDGEGYLEPRQCILGAIAWGAFCSTVLYIKSVHPEDVENDERNLVILPRNGKGESYDYLMSDKGLVAAPSKKKENPADYIREYIASIPVGETFETQDAIQAGGASRQYTATILRDLSKEGWITLERRGIYRRNQTASEAFFSGSPV
jgi:RecA-family ATPase